MFLKALHDRLTKLGPKFCFNLQTLFQTLFQTYSCVRKTMSEYVVYGNHIVVYGNHIVVYGFSNIYHIVVYGKHIVVYGFSNIYHIVVYGKHIVVYGKHIVKKRKSNNILNNIWMFWGNYFAERPQRVLRTCNIHIYIYKNQQGELTLITAKLSFSKNSNHQKHDPPNAIYSRIVNSFMEATVIPSIIPQINKHRIQDGSKIKTFPGTSRPVWIFTPFNGKAQSKKRSISNLFKFAPPKKKHPKCFPIPTCVGRVFPPLAT